MSKSDEKSEDTNKEFFEDGKGKNKGVKSPAEVAAQDELNSKAKVNFASKEDAENEEFIPLEEDVFYKVTVEKAEAKEYPRYNEAGTELKIVLVFSIDKRMDGETIKDTQGGIHEDGKRKFWEFLSTESTGFWHGKPGKTRSCVSALLNTDPEAEFGFNGPEDLVGKSCQVRLAVAQKKDGTMINKADKYKSLPQE